LGAGRALRGAVAEDLGLRALLVGVDRLPDVPEHLLIEVAPQLKWADFLRRLAPADERRFGWRAVSFDSPRDYCAPPAPPG
jgi:hypothetical protein